MQVDTAQFAAITDRLGATEAKVSALCAALAAAYRAAGEMAPAAFMARPEPRHARPRGHLRVVEGDRR